MISEELMARIKILENAEIWTKQKVEEAGYTVEANKCLKANDVIYTKREVLDSLFLVYSTEYREVNRDLPSTAKVAALTKELLAISLNKLIDGFWNKYLIDKNIALKFNEGSSLEPIENFVLACIGQKSRVDIYALAHWIWQVKRKMTNRHVQNHLMLVLYGKQGSGKSTAVDLLLSPITSYKIDMSVGSLTDERNYHTLQDRFVILCDEMHGCARADIENLKQVITATTVSARMLYTNSRDSISQNCTLIGTSNKSLDSIIRDDTGMRRFFSLNCKDKIDWKVINSIDPVAIWKCVDEKNDSGYLNDVMTEISELQEEYRHKDSVESYLDETKAREGGETEQTSVLDIYSDYSFWCQESGFKPVDKNYFCKQLKRHGIESTRTAKARYLLISKSFIKHSILRQGMTEEAYV